MSTDTEQDFLWFSITKRYYHNGHYYEEERLEIMHLELVPSYTPKPVAQALARSRRHHLLQRLKLRDNETLLPGEWTYHKPQDSGFCAKHPDVA